MEERLPLPPAAARLLRLLFKSLDVPSLSGARPKLTRDNSAINAVGDSRCCARLPVALFRMLPSPVALIPCNLPHVDGDMTSSTLLDVKTRRVAAAVVLMFN